MKITYLDHSGFSVSGENTLLVFDYCNPVPDNGNAGILTKADLSAFSQSILLLSHSHSDHYCREALQLPFTEFVLSDDFPASLSGRRVHMGDHLSLGALSLEVFGSTDIGVSYLVEVEGRRIFHAGDLNLWHWEEESTAQEIEEATVKFEYILDTLRPFTDTIDLAFFPLDPRMGKNTARGAERFLKVIQPKLLVPMHCQGFCELPRSFAAAHENVTALTERGETLDF